jgi:hypothetical protein
MVRFAAVLLVPVFLVVMWLPNGAWAEAPAATKEPNSRPEVTVEADRATLERRVNSFVSGITARPSQHESLARWNAAICPLVAGLPTEQGEFVLGRLSEVARSSGARLGPEHCRPNLYVLVASDPQLLLKKWRKKDPYIFGILDRQNPQHPPPAEVDRFIRTERPIRVWYNTNIPHSGGPTPYDTIADLQGGLVSSTKSFSSSNLVWDIVLNLSSVIVIIDPRRTSGFTLGQLAEYIAMVSFTRINLDADISNAPTVLRLFAASPGAAPGGLTSWDQGFLKGLYSTDQASTLQRFAITRVVMRDLAPQGP